MLPPGSSPRTRSPTRSGGSPTTCASCSTTKLSVYEVDRSAEMLVPVFALGEYAEGDKVLVAASQKLRSAVREDDVAPLGGEEFAPSCRASSTRTPPRPPSGRGRAIAEVQVGGRSLSCSGGVASFPDDERDARALARARRRRAVLGQGGTRAALRPAARGQLSGDGQRAEVEALCQGGLDRAGVPAGARSSPPAPRPATRGPSGTLDGPFRPPDQWFNQAQRGGLRTGLEAAARRAAARARPAGADVPGAEREPRRAALAPAPTAEVSLLEQSGMRRCSWCRSCSAAATSGCWSSTAASRSRGATARSSAQLLAHQLGAVLDFLARTVSGTAD